MSKLSNRLQEYMREQELTQVDLAKATGINRPNISEFLSGKHTPSYESFVTLLYYFECSADYLLGLTDIHTEEPLHPVPPFQERLRAMLKERKITQARLIKELPVSSSVLYKWLAGINQPSTDTLLRLASYFDCSVDYLIGRIR
ncbi:MAG: helix-turn-helix transcriptional regulator [Clostridia bacterium]|nr:helix-turn-helix transcriptional regulator [Clostridia bacterium]